jgi:hypothetical protein
VERTIEPLRNLQLPALEHVIVGWAEWMAEAIKADVATVAEPEFVLISPNSRSIQRSTYLGSWVKVHHEIFDGEQYDVAVRGGLVDPETPVFQGFLEAERGKTYEGTEASWRRQV